MRPSIMDVRSEPKVLQAASAPVAQQIRLAVAVQISALMVDTGDRLRALAMFKTHPVKPIDWSRSRDEQLIALGHLGETAAALISGVVQLVGSGNVYSASALNRQLLEVEYLAWAFANDPDEAAVWQTSNKDERLKRWQPRHLRERSKNTFRGADYSQHCEIGGHPTPDGMTSLLRGEPLAISGILLFEAATHGSSLWRYYLEAVARILLGRGFELTDFIDDDAAKNLVEAQDAWHGVENLPAAFREANAGE